MVPALHGLIQQGSNRTIVHRVANSLRLDIGTVRRLNGIVQKLRIELALKKLLTNLIHPIGRRVGKVVNLIPRIPGDYFGRLQGSHSDADLLAFEVGLQPLGNLTLALSRKGLSTDGRFGHLIIEDSIPGIEVLLCPMSSRGDVFPVQTANTL